MPQSTASQDGAPKTYNQPVKSDDRLEELRKQRQAAWDLLKRREPDLVRILEVWDSLLASHGDANARVPQDGHTERGPYSDFEAGADALIQYLQEHGPTKRLDAMKAVVRGGWAYDRPDAMGLMYDAVNYQMRRARKPKLIVSKGDILHIA
jgi:hypothetical protein